MYTWKLSTNLTDSKDPEWESLILQTLGEGVHSDRKNGFLLSREALKNALLDFGIKAKVSDLKLSNHHELVGFPELTISLSHTKEAGAALITNRKNFRSVGIDLEQDDRVVKDSIIERISHPEDQNLRNIEIWCGKEAVFKALMNTGLFPKPIEFGSIKLIDKKWFHSPSNLSGEWEIKRVSSFVVAFAYLEN